jgi:uncharacterized protein YndB with AHSA1/START domain
MSYDTPVFREPDLTGRPWQLAAERLIPLPAGTLFKAWTLEFDRWFAAPGSALLTGQPNTPFFFETEFRPVPEVPVSRHPHYGRFLKLIPDTFIQLTWVTGAGGTNGAETVLTVELIPQANGILVKLTHAGFADQTSMEAHRAAWPLVLEQLEKSYI